jgi:hypothetical protein
MVEAAGISETSRNIYQTTRCNNREDRHIKATVYSLSKRKMLKKLVTYVKHIS